MSCDIKQLEARIRQIYALDRNAAEIYSSISSLAPDAETGSLLDSMAREEERHMQFSMRILQLIGCEKNGQVP